MSHRIIGSKFIILESVDSTNNYAANQLDLANAANGTVIMAHHQTQGKGQRGSKWTSAPGDNLTFSIILNYPYKSEHAFYLTKSIAVGLSIALTKITHSTVHIKWPNDIYINSKKIAGILIESSGNSKEVQKTIVGIGVNVNQTIFKGLNATSLKLICNESQFLMDCLNAICEEMDISYGYFLQGLFKKIDSQYLEGLYLLNKESIFIVDQKEIKGKITGVNDRGELLLESQGRMHSFRNKEIIFTQEK